MANFKLSSVKPTIDIIQECVPDVYVSKIALVKMKVFVENCDKEVGWLGTAYQDKGTIYIDDMMLFDQEVSSVTTDISVEGLTSFGEKLLALPNGVDIWNSIKVWGHSHVNMGVTPSSVDDKQMITFKDNGHDWFIRIIGNKSGDLRIDLYNYKLGITYKNLPWKVLYTQEELNLIEQIAKLEEQLENYNEKIEENLTPSLLLDIKVMVSDKKSAIASTYNTKASGYYDYNQKRYVRYDEEDEEKNSYITNLSSYKNRGTEEETKKKTDTTGEKEDTNELYAIKEEVHLANIENGLYDGYICDDVVHCKDLEEVKDTLDVWGVEGVYDVYTDKDITNIWLKMIKLYNDSGDAEDDETIMVQ